MSDTTVVLFKDSESGSCDLGLLIPDYGIIVCLECGAILAPEDVKILYDFKGVAYLEQAVASGGFYDELPDELKSLYTGAK